MTNEIFGVDIAAMINSAFAGNLHQLTLYKITRTTDAYGVPVETSALYSGEGVRLAWDSRTVLNRGWPSDVVKILALQASGFPAPSKGDQIKILGDVWRVLEIEQDPVNATWKIAGVKS